MKKLSFKKNNIETNEQENNIKNSNKTNLKNIANKKNLRIIIPCACLLICCVIFIIVFITKKNTKTSSGESIAKKITNPFSQTKATETPLPKISLSFPDKNKTISDDAKIEVGKNLDNITPKDFGLDKFKKANPTKENITNALNKYIYYLNKGFFGLDQMTSNLRGYSVVCALEETTKCYINYATGNEWNTPSEFSKVWNKMLEDYPVFFYTLINSKDYTLQQKLYELNKYGYISYLFIDDFYNYTNQTKSYKPLSKKYGYTIELNDTEKQQLKRYYDSFNIKKEDLVYLKQYITKYMPLNK